RRGALRLRPHLSQRLGGVAAHHRLLVPQLPNSILDRRNLRAASEGKDDSDPDGPGSPHGGLDTGDDGDIQPPSYGSLPLPFKPDGFGPARISLMTSPRAHAGRR